MAEKSLDDLASYFRPLAEALINQCRASGVEVTIIDTLRTTAEQTVKIAQGVSWTNNSKHLPQPPEMLSEAIDICPTEYLTMKLWNPSGRLWSFIGAIGRGKGLRWGGDFPGHPDPGHFEYRHPAQNPVDSVIKT